MSARPAVTGSGVDRLDERLYRRLVVLGDLRRGDRRRAASESSSGSGAGGPEHGTLDELHAEADQGAQLRLARDLAGNEARADPRGHRQQRLDDGGPRADRGRPRP